MKKIFFYILIAWIFSPVKSNSQVEEILITEEMPEYPGGTNELSKYLLKNIRLDSIPEINQGLCSYPSKFYFEFLVNEDGKISNVKLIRPIEFISVEKEVRRVLMTSPNWKPKYENGKATKSKIIIPINICYK